MKKINNAVCMYLMLLFMIIILVSCGKHEHEYGEWIIITEATEESVGSKKQVCSTCDYENIVEIPKKEHVHNYCNEYYNNSTSHWNECSCGEKGNVSEHNYGEWIIVTEATEESVGNKKQVCNTCNYENIVEIPKLEHVHEYTSEVILPTCEKGGYTIHTCSCSDTYIDSEVSALEHDYVEEITIKATCEEKGLITYTCSHDSTHSYTEEIPALEHDYFENVCLNCGLNYYTKGLVFSLSTNGSSYIIKKYNGEDKNIVIPNLYNSLPVTSIVNGAFLGCSSITSIEIPSSVTSIGFGIFQECNNLTSIIVNENNKIFDSRENCNAIIEISSNILIAGCHTTKIPLGVTSIGDYAFFNCSSLTSIVIPEGVTSIGLSAFDGCNNLLNISIPYGLTNIGQGAFAKCSTLTNIEIPETVVKIGSSAFSDCISLTSIKIPYIVMNIEDYTFSGCINLLEIILPLSIKYIGNAFNNCSSITYVYYGGSKNNWSSIRLDAYKYEQILSLPIYYYSETKPTTPGNYWHYDTEFNPVVW